MKCMCPPEKRVICKIQIEPHQWFKLNDEEKDKVVEIGMCKTNKLKTKLFGEKNVKGG